jgi:deoxyribonuclease V
MALQTELAAAVSVGDDRERPWSSVAGIDVGLRSGVARAAVVVCSLDDLHIIEQVIVERPVTFPYVPGLLSFREAPVILAALAQLGARPDVLLFDAQGLAHPRRLGLASHVGVLLNWPSIGCAKSRLCGVAQEPPTARGGRCPLIDQGEVVGSVVRTRMGVRPVYVSAGHRVSLETAVDLVLHCGSGYRLPEPTRWAHRYASSA